ncbi:hypothetical protein [Paraburkholderia phosphatilytica]|uniref:hypothetical protein n=1 Tax=Paraburkholderia phosphatilytica TaxID=2282883 RepID=UPI001F0C0462|nr:hypothetical protein [Paraburkholderia phosphatilytica]
MLNAIRRFLAQFQPSTDRSDSPATQSIQDSFDVTWHGDHWQNLLASPMDARHYVMEDWSFAPSPAFADDPAH